MCFLVLLGYSIPLLEFALYSILPIVPCKILHLLVLWILPAYIVLSHIHLILLKYHWHLLLSFRYLFHHHNQRFDILSGLVLMLILRFVLVIPLGVFPEFLTLLEVDFLVLSFSYPF